jgi:hypothetical protein
MSPARIALYTISAAVLVATLYPWLQFLEADRCLDAGGRVADGACDLGGIQPRSFWKSTWAYKVVVVLPPVVIAIAVFAFLRFTFVREDVPPNKSFERTRER